MNGKNRMKTLEGINTPKGTMLGWDYKEHKSYDSSEVNWVVIEEYRVKSIVGDLEYLLLLCAKCGLKKSFSRGLPLWLMVCPLCGIGGKKNE